jgi:hypothetical protein
MCPDHRQSAVIAVEGMISAAAEPFHVLQPLQPAGFTLQETSSSVVTKYQLSEEASLNKTLVTQLSQLARRAIDDECVCEVMCCCTAALAPNINTAVPQLNHHISQGNAVCSVDLLYIYICHKA